MALTAAQITARDGKLTASRVGVLMSGNAEKILNLWMEIVGDPSFVPEDLSAVWPVQLGSHTESLHLDWMERHQGYALSRRGEVVVHPELSWAACTLDAWQESLPGPVECKHVNNYAKLDEVRARYMPQLHWQMLCTGKTQSVLSVIIGANEPVQETVVLDAEYAAELMGRAVQFWRCVETLTPPVALPGIAAPVPPDQMREISMHESNAWAEHASIWIANKDAAKAFEGSAKEIKALVPSDVRKATGRGIAVSRSKNGSLTIRGEAA